MYLIRDQMALMVHLQSDGIFLVDLVNRPFDPYILHIFSNWIIKLLTCYSSLQAYHYFLISLITIKFLSCHLNIPTPHNYSTIVIRIL